MENIKMKITKNKNKKQQYLFDIYKSNYNTYGSVKYLSKLFLIILCYFLGNIVYFFIFSPFCFIMFNSKKIFIT